MNMTVVKDWTTKAGLRGVIRLINDNHHCGYIQVPKDHAFFGVMYHDEDYVGEEIAKLDVHGGITYSEGFLYGVTSPEGAARREEWWLGFDCNHSGDLGMKDGKEAYWGRLRRATFKDAAYVELECEKLARQIAGWKAEI